VLGDVFALGHLLQERTVARVLVDSILQVRRDDREDVQIEVLASFLDQPLQRVREAALIAVLRPERDDDSDTNTRPSSHALAMLTT
jgi:hypothetical protein